MNVNLTPKLEQYVRDRVDAGDYNNASEVVREALRLMRRLNGRYALEMQRLQAAIDEGDAALAAGDASELASDEALDRFLAEI